MHHPVGWIKRSLGATLNAASAKCHQDLDLINNFVDIQDALPVSSAHARQVLINSLTQLAKEKGLGAVVAAVIIALARKFPGIIYQTPTNGWVFADFPRFVLANR